MEFKDMSTNERIDAVLRYLNDLYNKEREEKDWVDDDGSTVWLRSRNEIGRGIGRNTSETYGNEIQLILDYLEDVEGYISSIEIYDTPPNLVTKYRILYAGKVFIEDYGYVKRARERKCKIVIRVLYAVIIALGTSAAGAYGAFEIYQHYNNQSAHTTPLQQSVKCK